jgi:hypothetical protein
MKVVKDLVEPAGKKVPVHIACVHIPAFFALAPLSAKRHMHMSAHVNENMRVRACVRACVCCTFQHKNALCLHFTWNRIANLRIEYPLCGGVSLYKLKHVPQKPYANAGS